MNTWQPDMETRRKYKLTPYQTATGAWVHDNLAWGGRCSACGMPMTLSVGINRPVGALLHPNGTAQVVESSYDDHPCKAQPYRIARPLGPRDMAHPMTDAHFIPDEPSDLYRAVGLR